MPILPDNYQYVVLHHTGWGESHFDLFIEVDLTGPLRAWRLSGWPVDASTIISPQSPHRRAYLHYEGPVSRQRGDVKRIATGTYKVIGVTADSFKIELSDGRMLQLPESNKT